MVNWCNSFLIRVIKILRRSRINTALLVSAFLVLMVASGFLYQQNRIYQNQNRRLIILNDSILSENMELKNALQQEKNSASLNAKHGKFKTKKNK